MSIADLVIILIVLVSTIIGIRGFIREVFSLAAWGVSLAGAYIGAEIGATYLEGFINEQSVQVGIAFAVIFLVLLVATSILSLIVTRVLSIGGVSGVDMPLGMVFGFGRGVIIVALLIMLGIFMDMTEQAWWESAVLVEYFNPVVDMLRSLMSADMSAYFDSSNIPEIPEIEELLEIPEIEIE